MLCRCSRESDLETTLTGSTWSARVQFFKGRYFYLDPSIPTTSRAGYNRLIADRGGEIVDSCTAKPGVFCICNSRHSTAYKVVRGVGAGAGAGVGVGAGGGVVVVLRVFVRPCRG